METEEYGYVSIEDSETGTVDGDTNIWNTVLVPSNISDGDDSKVSGDEPQVTQEFIVHKMEEVEKEEIIEQEEDNREPLSYELHQGYRILRELMAESNKSVNFHFLEAVDDSYPETHDYYDKIKSPMWLNRMNEKFQLREYETITEFVTDFRLMLENCFRFNGPDHYVSKRGQRLETMLEQKLALLSRELREKTSIVATSGGTSTDGYSASGLRRRIKSIVPHDSSALLNHLREEELRQQREQRRQVIADRKAAQEAYLENLQEWENELMEVELQEQMKAMWELPAIGHFLFLCQDALNLEEVAQYELERCFMMPRQSSTLQRVMSSLLSTPFQRTKLEKKTMMPYCVWEEKLRKRVMLWYKALDDNHGNTFKAAYKLGIDAFFFDVAGKKDPLLKKKFHELSYYRKIWIVKTLCDNCLETQESLRDAIEAQVDEEQRSYKLGEDAKGNTYIHFPQFCGADLRVYRQDPVPEPEGYSSEEEEPVESEGSEEEEEVNTTPVKKRKLDTKNSSSKKGSGSRRSARRGRQAESEDTENENTPSEMSTEPCSRSMTATPEIVEEFEDETLGARKTRSGRARKNLYENGLTKDLERSLRRLRRQTKVEERKGNREESPSLASDSDRDYSSATDSNHNNNCSVGVESDRVVAAPDCVKSNRSSPGKDRASEERTSESCDNKCEKTDYNEREKTDIPQGEETNIKSIVKTEPNDLCKESGASVDSEMETKSAITNGNNCDSAEDDDKIYLKEVKAGIAGEKVGEKSAQCNSNGADFRDNVLMEKEKVKHDPDASIVADGINDEIKHENDNGHNKPMVDVKPETDSKENQYAHLEGERETKGDEAIEKVEVKENVDTDHVTTQDTDVSNEIKTESDIKGEKEGIATNDAEGETTVKTESGKTQEEGNESKEDVVKTEPVASHNEGTEEKGIKEDLKSEPMETQKEGREAKPEEVEEPEIVPEIGSFELVADSVEDLRLLAEKFAELPEPPTPVTTRGKKSKPARVPSRKQCVKVLHDRMLFLLKELEPWEPKLIQARRKAQVKMRKELDEYKEEIVKEQETKEWNTDDSSDGESETETDGKPRIKEEPVVKKVLSAPLVHSTDSRDSMASLEEDYEPDVSSRGRLRKRRVIPNNIEDQIFKKRKVVKTEEPPPAHQPNILQKQIRPTLPTQIICTTTNPMQSMSASQILRMSILGQTQPKTSVISPLATIGKAGVSVTQSSHPVIQSLLTTRHQQAAAAATSAILRQVKPRESLNPSVPTSGGAQATAASPGKLEVTGGNPPSSTQKILNSLPASVIQQLLKHKAIKIQTTGPGGTTLFLTSAVPTSQALSTTSLSQPVSQTTIINQSPRPLISGTTSINLPQLTGTFSLAGSKVSQVTNLATPLSAIKESTNVNVASTVIAPPPASIQTVDLSSSNESVFATPGNVMIPTTTVSPPKPPIVVYPQPGVTTTSSPPKQRYASNVTVKALLENRASQKANESVARSESVEGVSGVGLSTAANMAKPNVDMCKLMVPTNGGQFKPRVLKIPSQEALDNALQSVVTSVSTSLPTANIKVPSPVTLPSIQPRRNVTRTIQSMKAPIPVAHKVESSPAITMTSTSGFSQSASQSVITSQPSTQVSKSPLKTGYILQNSASPVNSNQKNMLLKVVPQNLLTSQGVVQGFLTPQGLVIPQQKQAGVSGPSAMHVSPAVTSQLTSPAQIVLNTTKSSPELTAAFVKTTVAGQQVVNQIQMAASPLKKAPVPSAVDAIHLAKLPGNMMKMVTAAGAIPTVTLAQGVASLSSATYTTTSLSGKGTKPAQIQVQTKVATPAAELVKQIAAGQGNIGQTFSARLLPQSLTGSVIPGKTPTSGMVTLMTRPPTSGPQSASVIPAVMVGQPAVASSLNSPRLLVPAQHMVGTSLQAGKTVNLSATPEVKKPPASVSPLHLSGKAPSPFVLSLGSGGQTMMLSPTKDSPSLGVISQVPPTNQLQIAMPQTTLKTTPSPGQATIHVPTSQALQLAGQQVVKITPQQLGSSAIVAQPGQSGIQVLQQQLQGTGSTASPKQFILSSQQVGKLGLPSGLKLVPQQATSSGIQTIVKQATPQLIHQNLQQPQVIGGQTETKSPLLPQQVMPLTNTTPGQIVQLGQQQLIINKSPSQLPVISGATLQGGSVQQSLKIIQSPGATLSQSQLLQLQGGLPTASPSLTVSSTQLTTSLPTAKSTQAAQPATKAALQAHLIQSKPSGIQEMPTLSNILGHEKMKVLATAVTLPSQIAGISGLVTQQASLSTSTVTVASNIKTAQAPVTAAEVDQPGGKQQKLLLYNIGGHLMTAQGVPVTVEQGVLKVVPQATIQIGNQMLTIKSPSSTTVENGDQKQNPKTPVVGKPPGYVIQSTDPKVPPSPVYQLPPGQLQDVRTKMTKDIKPQGPAVAPAAPVVQTAPQAITPETSPTNGQPPIDSTALPVTSTEEHVLQKTGSREEAALNLLSLAFER